MATMTLRESMKTFRTDQADDGWFEVDVDPAQGETIVFRHPIRQAAIEWLAEHIRILNMADNIRWIQLRDPG